MQQRVAIARLAALVVCLGCACVDPTTPDGELLPRKPLLGTLTLRTARYPPVRLTYDDGTVEFGRTVTGGQWQLAVLFRNPYPVPARVDTLWLWIGDGTGSDNPFHFVLWHTDSTNRPTGALELSPQFGARAPFGRWGIYRTWNIVLLPGQLFGAGMWQTSSAPIVIGHDLTSPFTNNSFFVALNGVPDWLSFEQLGVTDEVPMVRVSLSPVYGAVEVSGPTPGGGQANHYIVLESTTRTSPIPVGHFDFTR